MIVELRSLCGTTPWSEPKTMEVKLWGERDGLLLTGVRGGSKPHDLNSRSTQKLNAEEDVLPGATC